MIHLKVYEEHIEANDDELSDVILETGLVDLSQALRYLLAGKCIVTFVNSETKKHLTYKIMKCRGNSNLYFVYGLCGPNNTTDYKYFGIIRINGITPYYEYAKKSAIKSDSLLVLSFDAIWKIIITKTNEIKYLKIKDDKNVLSLNMKEAFLFEKSGKKSAIEIANEYATEHNFKDYLVIPHLDITNGKKIQKAYIQKKASPSKLLMYHSSRCCRCGRPLTVEDSILAGIGSICAWLMSIGK